MIPHARHLRKGKEKALLHRHPWIYSGAIARAEGKGDLAHIFSSTGELLGTALHSPGRSISAYLLAPGDQPPEQALSSHLDNAFRLRRRLFGPETTGYRLINAEGDQIPGLIVDWYAGVAVLQISHPGLQPFIPLLVDAIGAFPSTSIYEKSTTYLRRKEGMEEAKRLLAGEERPSVQIAENGLLFHIDVQEGQKTGFFLDQREMRQLIRSLSRDKTVLNCFAYTGAFTVSALAGGARHVASVEVSGKCEEKIGAHLALNRLDPARHAFFCQDVFTYLKRGAAGFDLVILDPPAFAKKKGDVDAAFRAYKELNAQAMRTMDPGSLLLTCSCSYQIGEELFQNILYRAALEANRSVKILSRHRAALDHPASLFHPEAGYLKSFLLEIS
jgi:23S rRNA (cytosine1962-C5)-methyltransferase